MKKKKRLSKQEAERTGMIHVDCTLCKAHGNINLCLQGDLTNVSRQRRSDYP